MKKSCWIYLLQHATTSQKNNQPTVQSTVFSNLSPDTWGNLAGQQHESVLNQHLIPASYARAADITELQTGENYPLSDTPRPLPDLKGSRPPFNSSPEQVGRNVSYDRQVMTPLVVASDQKLLSDELKSG